MDEIVNLASNLGGLISQHERFKKLRATEDAVNADEETRDLVRALDEQRAKIAELEAKQQPVEPEDKHELRRCTEAVHANPKLQDLARAQADYMELMNRVNQAIREKLDTTEESQKA